jgi:hypothetical protein
VPLKEGLERTIAYFVTELQGSDKAERDVAVS